MDTSAWKLLAPVYRLLVWQIVLNQRFVNDEFVSDKLSKCLYIHSYTHLLTSSALNEYLFGP